MVKSKEFCRLLSLLPEDYYVKFDRERDDEDGPESPLLNFMSIWQKPPPGGWPSMAAYFGQGPNSAWARVTEGRPQLQADAIRVSTGGFHDSRSADFADNCLHVLRSHLERIGIDWGLPQKPVGA